jgi:protein disulfide-isomerase
MKRFVPYVAAYAFFAMLAGASLMAEKKPDDAKPSAAGEPKWTEDYKAALAQAKKENKMLLLDFTGSDWCGWCIKLHNDVFSTPEFATWANKNFILVTVDFPKKPQSAELKAQNQALQKKYGIKGYPTIIFLDNNEKQLAQAGYDGNKGKAWCDARDKEIAAKK